MEDNVVFLTQNVFISVNLSSFSYKQEMATHFCKETMNEYIQFIETKTWIYNSYLIKLLSEQL